MKDNIAVFAHNFDDKNAGGGFPGRAGESLAALPTGRRFNRNNAETIQLVCPAAKVNVSGIGVAVSRYQ